MGASGVPLCQVAGEGERIVHCPRTGDNCGGGRSAGVGDLGAVVVICWDIELPGAEKSGACGVGGVDGAGLVHAVPSDMRDMGGMVEVWFGMSFDVVWGR